MKIIKGNLDLHNIRNTSLIEIKYFSEKADEAAQIANAVANAYRSYRLEQSFELMSNGIAALRTEWEAQEEKVHEAQTNIDKLRTQLMISEADPISFQPTPTLSVETVRQLQAELLLLKAGEANQKTE